MVLSSINCRGINNFEAINKMNQASKGGCCLITWAGPGENNHSKELNELVLGRQLKSEGGNDIIIPFNIIYSMGGMPELTYSTCCWEKKSTIDDAINQICNNYWRFIDITDEIKEKIKGYVVKNSHDGIYTEKAKHNVGIMVWDSWRIKD